MNLTEYIEQKKQNLIATNKSLSDEKLRVEGAWLILQEIEKMIETTPSVKYTDTPPQEGNETTHLKSPSEKGTQGMKTKKKRSK